MFTLPTRRTLIATLVLCSCSAVAQDQRHHARRAVELGWSYFNRGDAVTALKRFNQALLLDSSFAPAYFGIAYVYSVQNKLDLAIENYRECIKNDATFSPAHSNLGLALLYARRPKEALPSLQRALDIDPSNSDAHINIALYYFETRDYVLSWKHVHRAQQLGAAVSPDLLRDLNRELQEPDKSG